MSVERLPVELQPNRALLPVKQFLTANVVDAGKPEVHSQLLAGAPGSKKCLLLNQSLTQTRPNLHSGQATIVAESVVSFAYLQWFPDKDKSRAGHSCGRTTCFGYSQSWLCQFDYKYDGGFCAILFFLGYATYVLLCRCAQVGTRFYECQ